MTGRWDALDFRPPPSDLEETEPPVLLDYRSQDRVAVITLNRPRADNAINTEMGVLLTEIVETIAVRTAVRVVVLTGAGERAFITPLRSQRCTFRGGGAKAGTPANVHCERAVDLRRGSVRGTKRGQRDGASCAG